MTDFNYKDLKFQVLFERLAKSKFRSRFHLTEKEFKYIKEKGFSVIKEHAYDFVIKRLASKEILNDGKQTPMRGHPVFIAQHATATCCRGCLSKWHHISRNQELRKEQVDYIVMVIMYWLRKEVGCDVTR